MNQSDLCVFCNPSKPQMCGPFSLGEHTYATDGIILLRMPRLADVPEWEALNERAAVFFDDLDVEACSGAMVEIPDFLHVEPEVCPLCHGSGKATECPECGGGGTVTFENKFNEYECDCETCGGNVHVSGGSDICPYCDGAGARKVAKAVEVGCALLSSHYLSLMRDRLPGVKLAPMEPLKPCYFKWDDGDGLLMPMRAYSCDGPKNN